MNSRFLFAMSFIMLCLGCTENERQVTECGKLVEINKPLFNQTDDFHSLSVQNPIIIDECLTITLGYSGCNDGHDITLVTSGDVAESFPVQLHFKFIDNDPQSCEAYFTQEYNFDLSSLKEILGNEPKARLIFTQTSNEVLWDL